MVAIFYAIALVALSHLGIGWPLNIKNKHHIQFGHDITYMCGKLVLPYLSNQTVRTKFQQFGCISLTIQIRLDTHDICLALSHQSDVLYAAHVSKHSSMEIWPILAG